MEPYYPGKLTGDCYTVKDLLYFNATLVEEAPGHRGRDQSLL